MADSKLSALNPATSLNLGDLLLLTQAGSSLKIDVQTFALKMPSRIIVNEASESPASGALATNLLVSKVSSTSGVVNYTLASGTHGMEKQIVASSISGGGTCVVTVTSGAGVATITFNAVGDSVSLKNIDGLWYVFANNSVVIA